MSDLHACLWYTPIQQCWKSLITYTFKSQLQKGFLSYVFFRSNWNKDFFPMCFLSPIGICLSMYWHVLIATAETGKYKLVFLIFAWFYPVSFALGQPKYFDFRENIKKRELICDLLKSWSTITTWHRNRSCWHMVNAVKRCLIIHRMKRETRD